MGVLNSAPILAWSAGEIVSITGLEASFVGIFLLAAVTSFPELTTTFAAVRQRAVGIAVGNLFGSNAFNMLILGMLDLINGKGPLLNVGDKAHIVTGALSLVMMLLALAWVFTPSHRRWPPRQTSGALMVAIYVGGLYLVFQVA
jgi:cation:H+ antiporter